MSQDHSQPQLDDISRNPETGREVLPNEKRGCGHLKPNKAYIRGDAPGSIDGTVPRFVEFKPPIKYKVDSFRGIRRFPGIRFQLAHGSEVETEAGVDIKEKLGVDQLLEEVEDEEENFITKMMDKSADLFQLVSRLYLDDVEHTDANKNKESHAFDQLTWIGSSNYETPEEFIEETRKQGFNRGISVTQKSQPPVVNPFRTRVFCVHPNALVKKDGEYFRAQEQDIKDDDVDTYAGIIGYAVVNRVVHTVDTDGEVPEYVQNYQDNQELDIVERGEELDPEEETDEQSLDEVVEE